MPSMKLQLRKQSLKKFRLDHDSNPWPLPYRGSVVHYLTRIYGTQKLPSPNKKVLISLFLLTRPHLISLHYACSTHVSDCCYSSSASLITTDHEDRDLSVWTCNASDWLFPTLYRPDNAKVFRKSRNSNFVRMSYSFLAACPSNR